MSARSGSWRVAIERLKRSNDVGLLVLIAVSWWAYQTFGQGFLSSFNLFTLSQLVSETVVIGFAQLVVIAIARLNLAVGAIGVAAVMFGGWLMASLGLDPATASIAAVSLGAAIGAFSGWLELKTGLQSFIITLAVQSICVGAVLIISGGSSITALPSTVESIGGAQFFTPYVSVLLVPAAAVAALLYYMYHYSTLGWKMLAVGANQKAAELSGVPAPRMVVASFALSGGLSAIAGLMEMARVAAALPSLGGDWLLSSFIVPVLGGTALAGGAISIPGAVLAAIFIESINSGLVSMNVDAYWQEFAQAAALLLAVLIDKVRRTGSWRAALKRPLRLRTTGGSVG